MVPKPCGKTTGKKLISSPQMPRRLLFIASLHQPRELADETQAAPQSATLAMFQIIDDRPGVAEQFTIGEHLVTFSDHADLREKARYYLANDEERERIAAAARRHALARLRVEPRVARVLKLLESVKGFHHRGTEDTEGCHAAPLNIGGEGHFLV